jgi:hypothetical protein
MDGLMRWRSEKELGVLYPSEDAPTEEEQKMKETGDG